MATTARTRYMFLRRWTWAASSSLTFDIKKDHGVSQPIARFIMRFAFEVTAAGGGAMADLAQDASVQLMASRLRISATHNEAGPIKPIDMSGERLAQLWHLTNDLLGKEQDFSDPTPGAGASSNGRREFTICFDSPWAAAQFGSRLDPRDLTNLLVELETPAATVYAATNFSSAQNATIEFGVEVVEEGIEQGEPYFIPTYKDHTYTFGAVTNTDEVAPGVKPGGYVPLTSASPHDDSAVGNARRNLAGLIRRLSLSGAGKDLVYKRDWNQLVSQSESDFPLGFTVTRRVAPVTILHDKARNFSGMVEGKASDFQSKIDTSTAPQQGTTAVVAAAGDRLDLIFLTLVPNAAAARKMAS